MSTPRVKVSIEQHTKESIVKYLEVEAAQRAEVITTAVREAVDAFDFEGAVTEVCRQELDRFVRDTAAVYFRTLLTSPDAHAAILNSLQTQIGTHND